MENIMKRPVCVFLVHSFILLSYNSIVPSKTSSSQSTTQRFLVQFTVSSIFLKVIRQLLTSSSSPSPHFYPSLYLSFNKVLQNVVPTQSTSNQLAFLRFVICRLFLSPFTQCNTSPFLTRWVQLIFSILLQHYISKLPGISYLTSQASNFQHQTLQLICSIFLQHYISKLSGISDLHSQASNFQHQTQICSRCSILPGSFF